jgi:hypothetical protein
MLKTPSNSRSVKKRNPSLLKAFKKGGKDVEATDTAPNTPEEETGVTVVANEFDPSKELASPLTLQQIPSPLRGDHRASGSTKSKPSSAREEKKEEDPSVPGGDVDDVVSKTLNFFEEICALPQNPQIASEDGAQSTVASLLIKNNPHNLSQDSSYTGTGAYDDNTTSPSLPSETTGNDSSADPSTRYSNSYVSSYIENRKKIKKASGSATTAHDHENFEVVLDPASMTKEEKLVMKSVMENRGKRWNRISKSLATSLSPSAQKKGKINEEDDDIPLDEDFDRLLEGIDESSFEHERGEEKPVYNNNKEAKASTSVGGPKVFAKKILKNFKKIPSLMGEQNQQSHPAEFDSEAAVARKLEAKKSLEEEQFLQQDSPKHGVEPILEENDGANDADTGGMAKAWNDILAVTDDACPVASADTESPNTIKTKTLPRDSGASESPSTDLAEEERQRREDAAILERYSVEVLSHADKPQRRSFGSRLKKIQSGAYFNKSARKNKKIAKAKSANSKSALAENPSPVASPANMNPDKSFTTATEIQKPKLIWKSVKDPNSGRTYYYHRKTRETTWTKPGAFRRYELEYKMWKEATVGASTTNKTVLKKTKEERGSKEEEKASIRSSSWPKAVSNDAEKTGKSNATDILRTSTSPQEKNTMQLQMSDSPMKESKRKDLVDESNNRENASEKETGKTKLPFDESKSFDESTPFDEPLAEAEEDNEPGLLFLPPRSPARLGRNMTYTSRASARSALTDRTEKVRNTGRGKFSSINPIDENVSTATSISSFHDTERLGRGGVTAYRVPSRVPVHRERQLMVEELTDARLSAESYEGNAGERRGRIVRGRVREVEPAPEVSYDGDNDTAEDFGASTFDNETHGTDSVSALSENDTDFLSRKDNFDQARRLALDAAIEIEDWDLAAALSDGMRAVNLPGGYEKAHNSWNQSELDKFIANNDWNAVKSYIARMREQNKKEQETEPSEKKVPASPTSKRLGSRSQIQHGDVMSESSWSGSDSQSSYDDEETFDSESEI